MQIQHKPNSANVLDIINYIESHDIKFVSFKFLNDNRTLSQFDILSKNFIHYVKKNNASGPQNNIKNNKILLQVIKNQILILRKFFLDPFRSFATLSCFCDVYSYDTNLKNHTNIANLFHANSKNSALVLKLLSNEITQNIQDFSSCFIDFSIQFVLFDKPEADALESCTDSNNYNTKDNFLLHIANNASLNESAINNINTNYAMQVDPIDQFANLRSEIADILQSIGIDIVMHLHASVKNSCNIVIRSKKDVENMSFELEIMITKYIIWNVVYGYGKDLVFIYKNLYNIETPDNSKNNQSKDNMHQVIKDELYQNIATDISNDIIVMPYEIIIQNTQDRKGNKIIDTSNLQSILTNSYKNYIKSAAGEDANNSNSEIMSIIKKLLLYINIEW